MRQCSFSNEPLGNLFAMEDGSTSRGVMASVAGAAVIAMLCSLCWKAVREGRLKSDTLNSLYQLLNIARPSTDLVLGPTVLSIVSVYC